MNSDFNDDNNAVFLPSIKTLHSLSFIINSLWQKIWILCNLNCVRKTKLITSAREFLHDGSVNSIYFELHFDFGDQFYETKTITILSPWTNASNPNIINFQFKRLWRSSFPSSIKDCQSYL